MDRVTAGETFSLTYNVGSNGETYTACVTDAMGRRMTATTAEATPNVTVTVSYDQWRGGPSGWGRVEIRRQDTQTIVKRDRFRIMGGVSAEGGLTGDYGE
jgi:hypothetical protein